MRCVLLVPALLAWSPLFAADAKPPEGPWSDSFTMVLRDVERTFVMHDGNSYLVTRPEDFADRTFLIGKDVVLLGKFQHGQGDHIWLYKPQDLVVVAAPELWSDKVDGDNCYLFGHIAMDREQEHQELTVRGMAAAPSDSQTINAHLANIPKDAWDKRLAVAAWVRDQGSQQGNQDWWLQQSDAQLTHIIADAAAQAESTKDGGLLLKALDWAATLQKDPVNAARVASAPWVHTLGMKDLDLIALRMHRLGMAEYRDQWHPRSEALSLEFEDRFTALSWRDADGFYKLGRWADVNAELLPQAKDRAYRAYQAGMKANPDHPGIRRELGLDLTTGDTTSLQAGEGRFEYKDPTTGIILRSPAKWKHGDARDGVRWEDPASDTAYINARFIDLGGVKADELWVTISARVRTLPDFTVISETATTGKTDQHRLAYSFSEDRLKRLAVLVFLSEPLSQTGTVIEASFVEEERDKTVKSLADVIDHVQFPKPGTSGTAKPAAGTPKPAAGSTPVVPGAGTATDPNASASPPTSMPAPAPGGAAQPAPAVPATAAPAAVQPPPTPKPPAAATPGP